MRVVVRSNADGLVKASGYTPLMFSVNTDGKYWVRILGYSDRTFEHWQDNPEGLQIPNLRPASLDNDTALTAVFDTGDAQRGFTSITYDGAGGQPDLTVNAVSLDGNRTLHMWTIIDPLSSGSSGTTYKVYASNYQDRVFDHWDDGSTDRIRTLTISADTAMPAVYRTD